MSYQVAIASMSLGRALHHTIAPKFTAAATAGLPGIEIFFEDLLSHASSLPGGSSLPSNQLHAASQIRSLADSLSLSIMGIGPFSNYEGLLSPSGKEAKLKELNLWFQIARVLGTDTIQIPSTFMKEKDGFTGDLETVVRDLRIVAELGANENPPFRFAFENLCFGTFNDTWEKAWAVVKGVDRSNFGLCLDTFNIAGRGWADPSRVDGRIENADEVFAVSLQNMISEVDVQKIFYVQVVDAERLARPLDEKHPFYVEGQKARMSWSRNARLFMCEKERGGYLPVVDVLKAICDERTGLGYKGWISMELFSRSLIAEGDGVPAEHARRAAESWHKLVKIMGWEDKAEKLVPRKVIAKSSSVMGFPREAAEISARL